MLLFSHNRHSESERCAHVALSEREFDAPVNAPVRVCVGGQNVSLNP